MFGLNLFKWIIICGLFLFQAAQVQSQVQGQVHKCALVATSAHLYPALVQYSISSPIHLIAAQSHRGIYEYAQAPECCNVKTGHLGLDLGQKLSKLSLKDHCSRDPVQVQSLQ